jgi:hypothetical protein
LAIDEKDKPAVDSFKEVLSFYGTQIQSHAAVILGLAVLIFGIVQAWIPLATPGKLSWYQGPLFSIFMGLVGTGMVYQLLRFYMYGKMASALLNVSEGAFNWCKRDWNKGNPNEKWDQLPDLRKVGVFAGWVYGRYSKPWLMLKIFAKADKLIRPNPLFLILVFLAWSTSSYWLLFGAPGPYDLLEFFCFSGAITLTGFLVWQQILNPWVIEIYQNDLS